MFTLSQNLSVSEKEQIEDHFVLIKKQELNSSSHNHSQQRAYDFFNVQKGEPRFFIFEFLPNVKDWNELNFQLLSYNHLLRQLKPKYHLKLKILKSIQHINFLHIRRLQLNNFNIRSIEPISFINAPKLQHLVISQNPITQIRSITKTHLSSMIKLRISQDYLNDDQYQYFNRLYLNKFPRKIIQIQFYHWNGESPIINARQLLKCNQNMSHLSPSYDMTRSDKFLRQALKKINCKKQA